MSIVSFELALNRIYCQIYPEHPVYPSLFNVTSPFHNPGMLRISEKYDEVKLFGMCVLVIPSLRTGAPTCTTGFLQSF